MTPFHRSAGRNPTPTRARTRARTVRTVERTPARVRGVRALNATSTGAEP